MSKKYTDLTKISLYTFLVKKFNFFIGFKKKNPEGNELHSAVLNQRWLQINREMNNDDRSLNEDLRCRYIFNNFRPFLTHLKLTFYKCYFLYRVVSMAHKS